MKQTIPKSVAELVFARDFGCCFRCGAVCDGERGLDWSIHHRRLKGIGGDRRPNTNLAGNLIILCGSATTRCHGYVHLDNRLDALAHGWIVLRSEDDPTQEPALRFVNDGDHRWVYLDDQGRIHDDQPTAEAS